jgi:hypothetical protein
MVAVHGLSVNEWPDLRQSAADSQTDKSILIINHYLHLSPQDEQKMPQIRFQSAMCCP